MNITSLLPPPPSGAELTDLHHHVTRCDVARAERRKLARQLRQKAARRTRRENIAVWGSIFVVSLATGVGLCWAMCQLLFPL